MTCSSCGSTHADKVVIRGGSVLTILCKLCWRLGKGRAQ